MMGGNRLVKGTKAGMGILNYSPYIFYKPDRYFSFLAASRYITMKMTCCHTS